MIRVLFFFCSIFVVHAQFKVTHYTTANGLPHDSLYQLFQDSNGYMWVCTDNGLLKFDGQKFSTYNISNGLPNNYVIDITEVEKSKYALATWGGGVQILQNDSIYPIKSSAFLKINQIIDHKGYWVASFGRGIYLLSKNKGQYNTERWYINKQIQKPVENIFFSIKKVKDKVLLFGGNNVSKDGLTGVYNIQPESKNIQKKFPFFTTKKINDIIPFGDNLIAITDNEEYLFNDTYILKKHTLDFWGKKNKLRLKRVLRTGDYKVYITENIETNKDTVYIFHPNDLKTPIEVIPLSALTSDAILDHNGNIWISTFGNGLFYIKKQSLNFCNKTFNSNTIIDITEYKNKDLLYLSLKSLYKRSASGDIEPLILSKKDDAFIAFGTKYTNTNDTIYINMGFGEKINIISQQIPISQIETNRIDFNNYYLLYIRNRLLIYKNDTRQTKIDLESSVYIKEIYFHNDHYWIATNNGIYIYNKDFSKLTQKITAQQGLSNTNVTSIAFNGNHFFAGTINGLNSIDKNHKITKFDIPSSLSSNHINTLLVDHNKNLWIGTQNSVLLYYNNEIYKISDSHHGDSSFSVNKIYESSDHKIHIGTNKGVYVINNQKGFTPESPPRLLVKPVSKNSFRANAIDFSGLQIVKQYKLNNDHWKNFTENTIDFKEYGYKNHIVHFRVRNAKSEWVYSKNHLFSITPPWYKSIWFYISTGIVAGGFLLLRIRTVNQRNAFLYSVLTKNMQLTVELDNSRENIAKDFHDELGNKLAGINMVTSVILANKELKKKDPESYKLLQRIRNDATDLYHGVRDFIWSIDAKNDNVNELIIYLTEFGEELFANTGIKFLVDNKVTDAQPLPFYWSRQLLLLFKEAMTNTLKHSKTSLATLNVVIVKEELSISFQDFGKGFDTQKLKRKNGITNMHSRAKKIDGTLTIESINGTKITFKGTLK